jgi:hypothetical protein
MKKPRCPGRNIWVSVVNDFGRFGRWAFLEIKDPWNAATVTGNLLPTGDL